MMHSRRVVVTGLGMVTPLGCEVASSWSSLIAGKSGISRVSNFDVSSFRSQVAGLASNYSVDAYFSVKDQKRYSRFLQFAMLAGKQAMEDSGLQIDESNAGKCGVFVGSGIGGMDFIERNYRAYMEKGARRITPFLIPASICSMAAGVLSVTHGFRGPSYSIVSACATGGHNIGHAANIIAQGQVEVMLAGGAESASTVLGLGGFSAAKALSTRWNDQPEQASRPWDIDRDGFVMGEGAGVLVLESYEHAVGRGADIYAEVVGYAASCDAFHITQPPSNGRGAADCMRQALQSASLNPEDIGYINAHGTSTPLGDIAETTAIKSAFGESAKAVAISSNKSMTGHLLGASGGVEAIFSILSLRDNTIPPTVNLVHPDPECDLDYVPNYARQKDLKYVMSNSFGFGGTNASLIFKKI